MVVSREVGLEGKDGELMFNENSVSVLEEDKVLELDSSDG